MPGAFDFRDHRRELGPNRYVYAVVSRRAKGLSIGVNLNPDKVCNFDCPYCQVDRTTPGGPPEVRIEALLSELDELLARASRADFWASAPFDRVAAGLRRVADIAFAGDGEPTTPPEFPEAARAVREARDARRLRVPLRLLTNATLFQKERVHDALALFDELWCKLDAGTEDYFRLVDGTRIPFSRILDNLTRVGRERPLVIQSLFLSFAGQGPEGGEIEASVGRLRDLLGAGGRIDRVQVYTVARKPADPRVGALSHAQLEEIAVRVRGLGVPAEVYGAA